MSVQTNFRAVDMLGGPAKVETVVEAVKPVGKKVTPKAEVKVEEPVVVEETVVEPEVVVEDAPESTEE